MYKTTHFHPRQAAFAGASVTTTTTADGLFGIYNGSQYAVVLVIRFYNGIALSTSGGYSNILQGHLGATLTPATPLYAGDAQPAGQYWTAHPASQTFADENLLLQAGVPFQWNSDLPVCVLPPGWSFVLGVAQSGSNKFWGNVMWEELHPEQLDEDRFLQANLALVNG